MSPRYKASFFMLLPRLIVAGLLIFAAVPKTLAPEDFIEAVGNYRLLPPVLSYAAGLFLPWLELVVGVALVGPRRMRDGAWLLACVLCTVFVAAQLSALLRGLDIACGCFGNTGKIDAWSVVRRVVLWGFVMWGWRLDWLARDREKPGHETNAH